MEMKTIETAPTDGRWLLLGCWEWKTGRVGQWKWIALGRYRTRPDVVRTGWHTGRSQQRANPTHWAEEPTRGKG